MADRRAGQPGLEVVGPEQAGLEHYNAPPAFKQYNAPHQYDPVKAESFRYGGINQYDQAGGRTPAAERRICGLPRRTFWIVLAIIALVIVAAAVGGGVGGSLASRSSQDSASSTTSSMTSTTSSSPTSSATSSSSTTATRTTTPAISVTTTQVIGPTRTLLRDCPSSNDTVYNVKFGSTSLNFRKVCNMSPVNVNGFVAVVNQATVDLNACINLCAAYDLQNASAIARGDNRVCNAVCWRNTFDPRNTFPGQCFGYTTANITDSNGATQFMIGNNDICDGAAWMDQRNL